MKRRRSAPILLALALLLHGGTASWAGLRIVCTTPELGALARNVAGEAGTVTVIGRPDQDPHYVQAKPSHMVRLRRADAVVFNGLQLEIGWLPKLLEGARNPKLMAGRPGHLNASSAVERILEVPTGAIDRSQGDLHPDGNPHYLLDPRNGAAVSRWLGERFAELDPKEGEGYRRRAAAQAADIEGRIPAWQKRTAPLRGRHVIAHHKLFEYFADWLGLDIVDYVEDRPGIPASPAHIRELEERIGSGTVTAILQANYTAASSPQRLAERTGVPLLVLPATVTGEGGIDSYPDMIEAIVAALLSQTESTS